VGDTVVEASGAVARCQEVDKAVGTINGIPIITRDYGEITGLPPAQEGVMYIVSGLVRQACTRSDILSPGTLVRDDKGDILGCKNLITSTSRPEDGGVTWSDERRERGRYPKLFIVWGDVVEEFDPQRHHPDIVLVSHDKYTKCGKWSHTEYTLIPAGGVSLLEVCEPFEGWHISEKDNITDGCTVVSGSVGEEQKILSLAIARNQES
jgi:hypothetical protein